MGNAVSPEAVERDRLYHRSTSAIHARRRKRWLNQEKMRRGCVDCGYREHPDALEWDHTDPTTKTASIGRNSSSWKKIFTEIAKCDVRCSNCHAIRSAAQARARMGIPELDVQELLSGPQVVAFVPTQLDV